jgi:catechol 2,3-dioxygenase-like lactoylglutathione lyase family enzyme
MTGPAMDFKLEVVQVPVSDVDRAKAFYAENAGFNLDRDHQVSDDVRVVQLTPPGSGCAIVVGTGLSDMEPGCVQGLQLVVADIDAARTALVERGVDVSEIQVLGRPGRPGFRFASFRDPDGNGWILQEERPFEPGPGSRQ